MNIALIRTFGVSQSTLMAKDDLWIFSSFISYQDYILLPLILLASTIIYNRGSILPRRDPYAYKLFERPQSNLTHSRVSGHDNTRNVAEKIEAANADLVIFWGSQSGVAEGFAQRLAHEFTHRFKKIALVADLSDFDPHTLALIPRTKISIFIMSTYGEGDPSDNALEFVAWVGGEQEGSLENFQYAAFGCGNRNYRHYNKTIDDVVTGLTSRGATAVIPTGKGDESARSTEEDFLEWKRSLFAVLVSQSNLTEYEVRYEAGIEIVDVGEESTRTTQPTFEAHVPLARAVLKERLSEIVAVPITAHHVIATYEQPDRTCVHLELDLTAHPHIKYKTGDHIFIWPVNPDEEICSLLHILGLEPRKNAPILVLSRDRNYKPKVPSLTTPYTIFQHYLEICAPVPRESVLFLASLAPTEKAKKELKALAQTKDTYGNFLQRNYITLSRLLRYITEIDSSATWEDLPLSFIVDILPAMRPRTYSISSSPTVSPRRVSITVSTNPTGLAAKPDVTIPGLASTFLSSHPTANIYAQVCTSTFRLPISLSVPIVMVAAGTGLAPFRGFLQERAHVASVGREVGPMMLFFGCQDESNFLYRDLIRELQSGPLAGRLQIVTAFSRAKGTKRQYVGDLVTAQGDKVGCMLMKGDGAFYVCGATAIARSVKDSLKQVVKRLEGWDDVEADYWIQEKKKARRWFEDVWS
ncbi:hypothetical protein F4859DRAFT_521046 [Xylaria cf. heliscus]|nr:hypothetical protein F4859DRAFT_521046 [Xylaria cf. heliscus]